MYLLEIRYSTCGMYLLTIKPKTEKQKRTLMNSVLDNYELCEDASVTVQEIEMRSIVARAFDSNSITVKHDLFKEGQEWPSSTTIHCWHDCHSFTTMPVPMVARFDHLRNMAVCFGVFCSPECARAYAMEHEPVSNAQAVAFYSVVLHRSFGIRPENSSTVALPKLRLKMFGGDMDIQEFRKGFTSPVVQRVVNISFCMINAQFVNVEPGKTEHEHQQREEEEEEEKEEENNLASDPILADMVDTVLRERTVRRSTEETMTGTSVLGNFLEMLQICDGNAEEAKNALLSQANIGTKKQKK
jgi:hypothetical protein